MLKHWSVGTTSLAIFAVALATIVGAWIFEYAGYLPCELCLKQRWAYYLAIPLALIIAVAATSSPTMARRGLILLGLVWLASMVFGVFHSGVEWKWWPGPSTCTGNGISGGLPDLSKPVVMCDEPAIRILGLSLAGWNALISLALAGLALSAARRQGSSSESQ
jgi:disulfide bond formation protein DsbB